VKDMQMISRKFGTDRIRKIFLDYFRQKGGVVDFEVWAEEYSARWPLTKRIRSRAWEAWGAARNDYGDEPKPKPKAPVVIPSPQEDEEDVYMRPPKVEWGRVAADPLRLATALLMVAERGVTDAYDLISVNEYGALPGYRYPNVDISAVPEAVRAQAQAEWAAEQAAYESYLAGFELRRFLITVLGLDGEPEDTYIERWVHRSTGETREFLPLPPKPVEQRLRDWARAQEAFRAACDAAEEAWVQEAVTFLRQQGWQVE
jgi:hypothetical protein